MGFEGSATANQVPDPPATRARCHRRRLAALLALALAALPVHAQEPSFMAASMSAATDPAAACCSVIELRQYTLHPGQRDVLIELFEREFVETQEAQGIRLLGTFRDRADLDRFVWLRGFADMPARAAALQGFYSGPTWQAHRSAANATMVDSDNVLLLRPARAEAGFASDLRPLPPRDAAAIPVAVVEARLYYRDTLPSPADMALIDATGQALASAGATLLATLVTEPAANTFPQLPVRSGEAVIAWVAQFRDRASHDRYLAALAASPQWRQAEAALLQGAPRAPDVLLLAPTARSRLPR